jgi:hypothetical protein
MNDDVFAGGAMPPPPPPPGMPSSGNQSFTPPPPPPPVPQQNPEVTAEPVGAEEEKPVVPIGTFGREGEFQTSIKIPAHSLHFDENLFLRLLAGSISLKKNEKKQIIDSVPKLSQYQIDELIKIFQEEKDKFSQLDIAHKEQLKSLEAKHAAEWELLEMEYSQSAKQEEESAAADEIRKSLGL